MSCAYCDTTRAAGWRFCLRCGCPARLARDERVCDACGHLITPAARFCTFCGRPAAAPAPSARLAPARSGHAWKALLLGIFLPGAGQAYNGQFWFGIVVLITSLLVVPWILGCRQAFIAADRLQPPLAASRAFGIVVLHAWAAFVALLFVLVVLTLAGVLS